MTPVSQPRLSKRDKRLQRQSAPGATPQNNLSVKCVAPKTENQAITFSAFAEEKHLFLHGSAGTGKTFISMYLALRELEYANSPHKKIFLVRSTVPTRDMGFLPGNSKEKTKVYEQPYYAICAELYERGDAYEILKQKNLIEFMTTSFIRGTTLSNCIVIVDESQNLDWMELNSIITRAGENSRFIFCGDFKQDDLTSTRYKEESGIVKFKGVIEQMPDFHMTEFTRDDICRSELVRNYIIACENLGY